jgi:hypothetical protein
MKWDKRIARIFNSVKNQTIEMDPRPNTEFAKFINALGKTGYFEDEDHVNEFMSGDTRPSFFDYAAPDKFNVELEEPRTNIVLTIDPDFKTTSSETPNHVSEIQGKIIQAVEKAHQVSDTLRVESLRKLIRSHIQKLF